ncbi:hypothetical protein [Marivirga sp.]|uniref:hypothetical protein n=1 Tax=Marivirga sp. TaxID=2018662 RepID=UPI003DA720C4
MKKSIRKPENWQDFESLCKKLWGEIWECHEIKKNGRSGQNQHGVDVYGIPKNEIGYYGIQCKGKDDYVNSKLKKSEIDNEIKKARLFTPKLKKFYFATTANKDSLIEEYARVKDIESREDGFFEIHLFCWEDISDLIEENKNTFDWYVKNINHKIAFDVKVTFHDDTTHLDFNPKLVKKYITYKTIPFKPPTGGIFDLGYSPSENRKQRREIDIEPQPIRYFINGTNYNRSSCVFSIRIKNIGNTAIKNYKMYFDIDSDGVTVDTVSKQDKFYDLYQYTYNTFMFKGTNNGVFEPEETILVQKDSIRTDDICLRPNIEGSQKVNIKWKLVSEDFADEGILTLQLNTEIIERESVEEDEIPREDEIVFLNYVE